MGVLYLSSADLDDVIAAAQADPADNTAAMAEILHRFEGTVVRIARSITSNPHLVQDAAQGARLGLVRAVRAHTIGTFGFTSYAKRFMTGAALRVVRSMITDEIATDPQDTVWLETAPHVAQVDTTFDIIELFRALKPDQQIIAVAHYVGDYRLRDIAYGLGISTPAVSQRLSTIHRALRPQMEHALAA